MAAVDKDAPPAQDGPPSVASTLSDDPPAYPQQHDTDDTLKKPEREPSSEEQARAKMARCISALCACAATVSFVLLVIGVSTSSWLTFNTSGSAINPVRTNSKFAASLAPGDVAGGETGVDSNKNIQYALAYYGLYNACYREKKGATTCSLANLRCSSSVCWNRKTAATSGATRACKKSKIAPLKIAGQRNCLWYQISRIAAGVALVFAAFGTSAHVVSTCTGNKPIGMLGGIMSFFSGLAGCALFVLIYLGIYLNTAGYGKNIFLGWSFWLVIVSWPLAVLAGLAACCNASLSGPYRESADYRVDE